MDEFGTVFSEGGAEGGISFSAVPKQVYRPDDTEVLARKYSIAVGPDSELDTDTLRNRIANGDIEGIRNWTASKKDGQAERIREETVARFVATNTPSKVNADLAQGIATTDLRSNPNTVLESEYVSKVLDNIRMLGEEDKTDAVNALYDRAKDSLTKKELFARLQAEVKPQIEESLLSVDFAETFVPFLSWSRFRQEIKNNNLASQFWQGDNVDELISKFYSLPAEEGYKQAKETILRLAESNKFDAATLAAALVNYGNSDKFWDNVSTGLDLTSIPGTSAALRGVAKVVGNRAHVPSKIADAAGHTELAAKMRVMEDAASPKLDELGPIMDKVPTVFAPKKVTEVGNSSFSAAFANRLQTALETNAGNILGKVTEMLPVKRLDEGSKALETAIDEATEYLKANYSSRFADAILDIKPLDTAERLGNVPGVELALGKAPSTKAVKAELTNAANPLDGADRGIKLKAANVDVAVGQNNGLLFGTKAQAENHAKNIYQFIDGQYSIKQHGQGYYISIVKNVDETSLGVYRAQAIETKHKPERGILGLVKDKLGLTETLMTETMSQARKTSVYGSSDVLESLAQHYKANIESFLPRKENKENFSKFINTQRDTTKGGKVGKFSENLAEFEQDWRQVHGKAPTEAEAHAYFSYTQLSDMDWVLRNMDVYEKQAQAGWSMFSFDLKGIKFKKPIFEGKKVDKIEYAPDNFTSVVVLGDTLEATRHNGRGQTLLRKDIQDMIDSGGYSVIKMHSQASDKLRAIPGAAKFLPEGDIHYVLTKTYKEGPLDFNRVAYRPGGHKEYTDDWFISSPIVKQTGDADNPSFFFNTYLKDFNVGSAKTKEQAQFFVDKFNKAREMYVAGDRLGLHKYIVDNFPSGFDIKRFERMASEVDMTKPFLIRRNGTNLDQAYPLAQQYQNYRPAGKNPLRADEAGETTSYLTQRQDDLPLFAVEGSDTNPVVRLGSATLLDASEAMARSFNNIVKGRYLEDVKVKHAREFMAKYADLIEVPNAAEARLNPFKYALDAPFKKNVTDSKLLAEAQTYRQAMSNFLGIENSEQLAVRTFRDKLLSGVMKTFGEGKVYQVLDARLAHKIQDPTSFLRGLAFHEHMGLFNPMSYLTQLSQFTHIAAINPVEAPRALAWSHFQNLMRVASPKVQEALAAKAAAWGGQADHFKEAYEGYMRSGLRTVGNTVSYLDDLTEVNLTKGTGTKILDAGRVFFDAGERTTRRIAYNSAYLEWRTANPTKKFGDEAQAWVLNRSDTLTGNMTKASYSTWQKGIAQVPTQFMNYHFRLSEQILGGKLTSAEATRVMAMNSVLYGVPVGTLGTTVGLAPWGEYARQYFDKKGIDFDSNLFLKGFLEGGLNVMSKQFLGDGFNWGDRFGPAGKSPIVSMLSGDSFLEIMGGAGGKTVMDMVLAASPLAYTVMGVVNGDDEVYPLSLEDFKQAITSNIASLGHMEKTYTILKTGEFMSKKGVPIAEVDNWKGYVFGMLGLSPEEVTRGMDKVQINKSIKEVKDKYEKEALNAMTKAYKAPDLEGYSEQMKRARVFLELGGFTPQEKFRIQGRAAKSNETMVERAERMFKDSTPERLRQHLDKMRNAQ